MKKIVSAPFTLSPMPCAKLSSSFANNLNQTYLCFSCLISWKYSSALPVLSSMVELARGVMYYCVPCALLTALAIWVRCSCRIFGRTSSGMIVMRCFLSIFSAQLLVYVVYPHLLARPVPVQFLVEGLMGSSSNL